MLQGKHIINPKSEIQNQYNKEYTFEIATDSYLTSVFDAIPSKSIINKGRCGIGGTVLEIRAMRNSIIVVPTNAIIDDKCFDSKGNLFDKFFVVRGKGTKKMYQELSDFVNDEITKDKKIFCTPESFYKILKCNIPADKLYKEWFVLVDESHSAITDDFRDDMLDPYNYIFLFDNVSFISATPFKFSSEKLKGFDIYNISFPGSIGKVFVHSTNNPEALLFKMLVKPDQFPGRVHVFLNSIHEIANIIRKLQITNIAIFCSDIQKNKRKLDELAGYLQSKPSEKTFQKYNFYTSKYFEGWDLKDLNATIIIVSDVNINTLKSGISNKCIQASGRNREKSNKIIHITNDYKCGSQQLFSEIKEDMHTLADSFILNTNRHISECNLKNISSDKIVHSRLEQYADIDNASGLGAKNDFKVDRMINREYCNQEYNNPIAIKNAWEKGYYSVIITPEFVPELSEYGKRLSQANKIKVTVEFLQSLNEPLSEELQHYFERSSFLPENFNEIRGYFNELGIDKIRVLEYNPKLTRMEYIKSRNLKYVPEIKERYFNKVGHQKKTKEEIKDILGDIFAQLGVLDPKAISDNILKPTPKYLKSIYTKVIHTRIDSESAYKIKIY